MFWCQHLSGASYFTCAHWARKPYLYECRAAVCLNLFWSSLYPLLSFLTCSHDGYKLNVYKPLWIGAAEACFSLFFRSPPPTSLSQPCTGHVVLAVSWHHPASCGLFSLCLSSMKFLFGDWSFLWSYCLERCKCCKNMYIIFRVVRKSLCDDESPVFLHSSWSVCPCSCIVRLCETLSMSKSVWHCCCNDIYVRYIEVWAVT